MKYLERTPPTRLTQLIDVLLIELTNWRWSWRTMLVVDTLTPLLSMLALGVFARDSGSHSLEYVFTGNIVVALMFGTMRKIEGHLGYLRYSGALDYFATLPEILTENSSPFCPSPIAPISIVSNSTTLEGIPDEPPCPTSS